MNLYNDINAMNNYLKSVFDTFGGQSVEYGKALQNIRENIPDETLKQTAIKGLDYQGDKPNEPLQFSKGNNAQNILSNFENDISKIRNNQKDNSVNALKERYKESLKANQKNVTKEAIKEEAKKRYDFNNNSNDWYKTLTESDNLTDDEKEEVRNIYSEISAKYDDPEWRADNIDGRLHELLDKHYNSTLDNNSDDEYPIDDGFAVNPNDLL